MPEESKQTTLSDVIKPIEPPTEKPAAAPVEDNPYGGKSVEELTEALAARDKSYDELRKLQSRQANELGEARRLADQLIRTDLEKRTIATEPSKTVDINLDSFDDPKEATAAISAMIDRRVEERLAGVQAKVGELTGMTVEQRLNNDHPDWRSIVMSQEYTDWVKASKVRTRLAQEGNGGDYDSGHELLSMWEAIHPKAAATAGDSQDPTPDPKQEEALKSATLETGASGPRPATKPVYRYADIMELRVKDPDRYDSMRAEVRQAFAEGRVK